MTDRLPGFATLAVHAGAQPRSDHRSPRRRRSIRPRHSYSTMPITPRRCSDCRPFGKQSIPASPTPTTSGAGRNAIASPRRRQPRRFATGIRPRCAKWWCSKMLLKPGDEFVAARKLYGGSINQFTHALQEFRLETWLWAWIPDDVESFETRRSRRHTKAISSVESIANPSGSVTDYRSPSAARSPAKAGRAAGSSTNTLATPYLIRPIDHGADIVVHFAGPSFSAATAIRLGGIIVGRRHLRLVERQINIRC